MKILLVRDLLVFVISLLFNALGCILLNVWLDRKKSKPRIVEKDGKYAIESGRWSKKYLDLVSMRYWWSPYDSFEFDYCWSSLEKVLDCWDKLLCIDKIKKTNIEALRKADLRKNIKIVEKI